MTPENRKKMKAAFAKPKETRSKATTTEVFASVADLFDAGKHSNFTILLYTAGEYGGPPVGAHTLIHGGNGQKQFLEVLLETLFIACQRISETAGPEHLVPWAEAALGDAAAARAAKQKGG